VIESGGNVASETERVRRLTEFAEALRDFCERGAKRRT